MGVHSILQRSISHKSEKYFPEYTFPSFTCLARRASWDGSFISYGELYVPSPLPNSSAMLPSHCFTDSLQDVNVISITNTINRDVIFFFTSTLLLNVFIFDNYATNAAVFIQWVSWEICFSIRIHPSLRCPDHSRS